MPTGIVASGVWLDKFIYHDAEKNYHEHLAKGGGVCDYQQTSLASEVAKARQHIKYSLQCIDSIDTMASLTTNKTQPEGVVSAAQVKALEDTTKKLEEQVRAMQTQLKEMSLKLNRLHEAEQSKCAPVKKSTPAAAPARTPAADDDDVDLFGSDSEEEDESSKQIREQRLAEYAAKKSKKPQLIAKSNIILDVKPWDDETDMKELEKAVRKTNTDGLVWGASKLVPLAYGIHKLQISCVVEDDKVSVDWLTETLQEIEDYVQSVDIAAFNKV